MMADASAKWATEKLADLIVRSHGGISQTISCELMSCDASTLMERFASDSEHMRGNG
jgi:hypothetical protein